MASDYGLNFGFRRSDESMGIREGRFKTPVGSALKLGTAVRVDAASPGYVKAVPVGDINVTPQIGLFGVLVQEEIHIRSIYETDTVDSYGLGVARADKLSVIYSGAGTKVWFRNNATSTRADGRVIAAVTIVDVTGLAVGDPIGWNGTNWLKSDSGTTYKDWFRCTSVSGSGATAYVEAVFQF